MISNVEEALLLLKKWKTESSRVIALIGRRSMIVRLEGVVGLVTDDSFSVVSGESFIYVSLSGCTVNYAGTAELEETMKDHLPKNWESSIHLEFPEKGGLSLFGVPAELNALEIK
jgi:hypothetical protein